jgi:hypothetical protein
MKLTTMDELGRHRQRLYLDAKSRFARASEEVTTGRSTADGRDYICLGNFSLKASTEARIKEHSREQISDRLSRRPTFAPLLREHAYCSDLRGPSNQSWQFHRARRSRAINCFGTTVFESSVPHRRTTTAPALRAVRRAAATRNASMTLSTLAAAACMPRTSRHRPAISRATPVAQSRWIW